MIKPKTSAKVSLVLALNLLLVLGGNTQLLAQEASDVLQGTVVEEKEQTPPQSKVLTGGVSHTATLKEKIATDEVVGSVVETKNPFNKFPPCAVVSGVVYEPQAQMDPASTAAAVGILTGIMGAVSAAQGARRTCPTPGYTPSYTPSYTPVKKPVCNGNGSCPTPMRKRYPGF